MNSLELWYSVSANDSEPKEEEEEDSLGAAFFLKFELRGGYRGLKGGEGCCCCCRIFILIKPLARNGGGGWGSKFNLCDMLGWW